MRVEQPLTDVADHTSTDAPKPSILKQPKAVFAVAFACVISFMGLGLVDPILPAIAKELHANKSQVELLFTSYMLVTGIAMVITGYVSSRIGPKRTLITGLLFIILFSALGGFAMNVGQIVWFRGGWGLGNALFIATALAVIVSVATGGTAKAIILYEAALGLGISVGPLLGGELGGISWRGPFFGVAVLMLIALVGITFMLPPIPKAQRKSSILDPFRALKHRGLLTIAIQALLYNFGFFTLLAYTPFVLNAFNLNVHELGYVFFGWGIMLAVTSVFVAPKVEAKLGTLKSMYLMLFLLAVTLLIMGLATKSETTIVLCVIVAGAFLGVHNTVVTTAVMEVAPVERSIASAAYSFMRFVGGAIAPWLAGFLSDKINASVPFYVGCAALIVGILVLMSGRKSLSHV